MKTTKVPGATFTFSILTFITVIFLVFAACDLNGDDGAASVTGVTLDKTDLTLPAGYTETLAATVQPQNAGNKNVSWSSSNTDVAMVYNGTVTAVSAGTAIITVTTENGRKTATCTVKVQTADRDTGSSGIPAFSAIEPLKNYLMDTNGGRSEIDPVPVRIVGWNIDWPELLDALLDVERYVELDLSLASGMGDFTDDSVFPNPGKKFVVFLVLPISTTAIGSYSFDDCTNLAHVAIPDRVAAIEDSAFTGCSSLATIVIPNSVTSIGDSAFTGCSGLTGIIIPASVTSLGAFVFQDCTGLISVTLGEKVASIEQYAFSGCKSLTTVSMPNVASIGDSAFTGCSSLTGITIPAGVTSLGSGAFWNCASLASVTFLGSDTNIAEGIGVGIFPSFQGDLRAKYLDEGMGTYRAANPGDNPEWTKQ